MRRAVVLALVLAGCAPVRFVDRAVVWRDPDDAPIPRPKERVIDVDWTSVRDVVFVPLDRALTLDYGVEAVNVNALDEVPESSWFHDPRRDPAAPSARPRALTDEEMARGAVRDEDVPVQPLTITKVKTVGAARGFQARDARGVRYMIKLDPPGRPGFATAVEVVVSRLAWACGFRVPAEVMLEVPVAELKVAPGVELDLKKLLDGLPVAPDGTMKMLASRWLPGVAMGPFRAEGLRRDDPNDRFPHQNRRELRGFGVFSAWVNNVDTLENNTLDMYEGPPGRGHLVHYQQDVGGAFGVWAFGPMQYWMGHETYFDFPHILRALFGIGFTSGYWEDERFRAGYEAQAEASPELGGFDAEHFDPRRWRPNIPTAAIARGTARDRYWAAKRIALVDERELKAAISAGHYAPRIAARVLDILWKRREKLLRAWFADVTPLDHFRFEADQLCFDDLWVRAGLGGTPVWSARLGREVQPVTVREPDVGCAAAPGSGYRVVELRMDRAGAKRVAPVRVHLVDRRVVGVER